jgi:hypothetical protein
MATPTKEVIQRLVSLGYPESVAKRIAGGELPMDYASRMQRAADQGYSPVQYHGTRANITEFQPSDKGKMGGGVYTAAYPRQSNMHATPGFNSNRMNTEQIDPSVLNEELLINSGANVLPVVTRGNYANRWDAIKANPELYGPEADRMLTQRLIDQGYDGIDLTGYGSKRAEGDLKERVTFDPNNIRSLLSAAFDPEYTGSNIMGSRLAPTAAAGLLGASAMMAPENAEAATAYKLFRQANDKLYPLFVNRNQEVPVGEWLRAEAGELTDQGKVKSSLGPLAYRPGWHAGDLPMATHIGGKSGPVKAPNYRPSDQVWAEVEFPEDVDWQAIADANATRNKAGEIIPRTAQITDQVPYGGFYRYKTNPNMTGEWLIGGDMRVNRVLSDEEVRAINESAGVADLPRLQSIKDKTMLAAPAVGAGLLGASVLGSPDASANSVLPYNSREDLIASIEGRLRPLPEPEPTIAPTENDTIGQIVNTVANLFGGGYHDYRAAENLMNGADFLPYVGSGISLQQGADAYRQGKVGEGRLLTGLGLLEFIPVAGKIASEAAKARRAGRAANRSLDDFASRMSEAEIATRAPQTQEELMRALGWQ